MELNVGKGLVAGLDEGCDEKIAEKSKIKIKRRFITAQ